MKYRRLVMLAQVITLAIMAGHSLWAFISNGCRNLTLESALGKQTVIVIAITAIIYIALTIVQARLEYVTLKKLDDSLYEKAHEIVDTLKSNK